MKGIILFYLFTLLVITTIFCSCSNAKKAQKHVAKISVTYPEVLAEYCSDKFPVKEIFIPGDTITVIDTLVNSDLVIISDTVLMKDTIIITRTLPPKVITKTITITDTVVKENTARLIVCELERGKVVDLLTDSNKQLTNFKEKAKNRGMFMWSFLTAFILMTVWKVYGWFK